MLPIQGAVYEFTVSSGLWVSVKRSTMPGTHAGSVPFTLQHRIKAHARIIWGVAWSPDSALFATASRDGSARLWCCSRLSDSAKPSATITLGRPVTAIAFDARNPSARVGSDDAKHQYTVALGLETGRVMVYTISRQDDDILASCQWESSAEYSHCAPVRRICWQSGQPDCQVYFQHQTCFATCADDHCVRIFKIGNQT